MELCFHKINMNTKEIRIIRNIPKTTTEIVMNVFCLIRFTRDQQGDTVECIVVPQNGNQVSTSITINLGCKINISNEQIYHLLNQ